ncbi:MAG: beta-L-arabinofuranosidase domain-containing protein, partial [Acidobacteriaceae bacterium]
MTSRTLPGSTAITDTSCSPNACLRPVSIRKVQLEAGFWKTYQELIQSVTIPTQYDLLESTGRLDNFHRVSNGLDKPFQGYVFNDSDVYKWLEAASWALLDFPDHELIKKIEKVISSVCSAQADDGYINT